jgi:hypothetical protein
MKKDGNQLIDFELLTKILEEFSDVLDGKRITLEEADYVALRFKQFTEYLVKRGIKQVDREQVEDYLEDTGRGVS